VCEERASQVVGQLEGWTGIFVHREFCRISRLLPFYDLAALGLPSSTLTFL